MYFGLIGLGIAFLVVLLVALAVWVVVWYFFLLNLKNLLLRISPQNRRMSPDQVWLNFIPVFNLYWLIRTVIAVRDSARSEFQSRGWPAGGDFCYNIGLPMAILIIVSAIFDMIPGISWLGSVAGLVAFVLWIIYWVKTYNLMNQLGQPMAQPPFIANQGYPTYGSGPAGYQPPQYGGQPGYQPPQPQQAQPQQWQPQQWPPAQPAPQTPAPQWTSPQQNPTPSSPAPAGSTPGAGQEAPKACGACGAELKPGQDFCNACGMPVPKKQDS
jgi:hypothetical protein